MKLCLLIFCLFIVSCNLSPRYERPEMEMPYEWRIPTEEATETSNIDWWKQFNDPVLDGLIDKALQHNQDIKVAIYTVDQFVAKLGIARSQLYPQISANASGGREKVSTTIGTTQPGLPPIFNDYSLLFNVSYLVDIWGQIRSTVEAARASLYAEIQTRRGVVLTVVSSLASSYIKLRQFDLQLVIAYETLNSRLEAYKIAEVRYELGLTSEIEVDQAKAEVETALIEVDQLKINIALEEDLICVLTGEPPSSVERGKLLIEIQTPPSVPAELPSELLNQRPDILSAEQNLISANAQIGVARSQFFPQINLVGDYGWQTSFWHQFFTVPSSVWQYGVTILQEIFTGGELTSNLNLTIAQKSTLVHQYQSTVLNAFKEVNDALISHKISLQLVEDHKERVKTLAEYLKLATLRYEDGLTDYLTYLDAERQLFAAELDYAAALGTSFTTLIDIYAALGGGWVVEADRSVLNYLK